MLDIVNYKKISSLQADLEGKAKINAYTDRVPTISFVSDDGMVSDYNILKPLTIKYGVPFCSAIVTSNIGQTVDGYNHMTSSQLTELVNNYGWEILSHTHSHSVLGNLTEGQVRTECEESISILKDLRLDCKGLVYPEGNNTPLVRKIVADYFDYAIRVQDYAYTVNTGPIGNFYIFRCNLGAYFDPARTGYPATNTLDYYKQLVNDCIAMTGWLIFELHTWNSDFNATQQGYLDDLLAYIASKSVQVVKTSDAFKLFGNQIQSGDFLAQRNYAGLAIDKSGNISNGFPSDLTRYTVNNNTPLTSFALNKTSTFPISNFDGVNSNHGFPTAYGLLETKSYNGYDFSVQTWYGTQTDSVYYRKALSDTTWGVWHEIV